MCVLTSGSRPRVVLIQMCPLLLLLLSALLQGAVQCRSHPACIYCVIYKP